MVKSNLEKWKNDLKKSKEELNKLTYKGGKKKKEIHCYSCGELISSKSVKKCPNCGNYIRGNLPADIVHPGDYESYDFDENYTYDDYIAEIAWDEIDRAKSRKKEKAEKIIKLKEKIKDLRKKIRSEKYRILINIFSIVIFSTSFVGIYLLRLSIKEWCNVLSPWIIIPFFLCVYYGLYYGLFALIKYFYDNKITKNIGVISSYISIGAFLFMIIGLPLGIGIIAMIGNIMD